MKFFSGSKTWFQVAILQEPNNIMNQYYVVISFEALKNGLKKNANQYFVVSNLFVWIISIISSSNGLKAHSQVFDNFW